MSTWRAEMRKLEAEHRRDEREAKKRERELERNLKEQAKLSALEKARLEVEAYENSVEVLLSVHKEQHAKLDWKALASALRPHEPTRFCRHELRVIPSTFDSSDSSAVGIKTARELDEDEYRVACAEFANELAQWTKLNSLAKRVLAGEAHAYTEAMSEFPVLAEISNLGSSIHLTIHNRELVECVLKVKKIDIIPAETKSLNSAGKLVVKPMPKVRSHALYQDYVSGCILRLARELLALLPIKNTILTATVDSINPRNGRRAEVPVLSIVAPRTVIEHLNFDHIDPSDALENFQLRGDLMPSKKSENFVPIVPLTPNDIESMDTKGSDFSPLMSRITQLRKEFATLLQSPAA